VRRKKSCFLAGFQPIFINSIESNKLAVVLQFKKYIGIGLALMHFNHSRNVQKMINRFLYNKKINGFFHSYFRGDCFFKTIHAHLWRRLL
jgi:hypothetical protein